MDVYFSRIFLVNGSSISINFMFYTDSGIVLQGNGSLPNFIAAFLNNCLVQVIYVKCTSVSGHL